MTDEKVDEALERLYRSMTIAIICLMISGVLAGVLDWRGRHGMANLGMGLVILFLGYIVGLLRSMALFAPEVEDEDGADGEA